MTLQEFPQGFAMSSEDEMVVHLISRNKSTLQRVAKKPFPGSTKEMTKAKPFRMLLKTRQVWTWQQVWTLFLACFLFPFSKEITIRLARGKSMTAKQGYTQPSL